MLKRTFYMVPVLEEIFIIEKENVWNREHTENIMDHKNEKPIMLIIEYPTREK